MTLSVNNKPFQTYAHILVLQAFVGPCPPGYVTRHFPDRTRTNNNLSNLSWDTRKVNQADRLIHGTDHRGAKHKNAKLNDVLVRIIRDADLSTYGSGAALARKLGVTPSTIYDTKSGKRWGHVT